MLNVTSANTQSHDSSYRRARSRNPISQGYSLEPDPQNTLSEMLLTALDDVRSIRGCHDQRLAHLPRTIGKIELCQAGSCPPTLQIAFHMRLSLG